jgi:hypothetical protein
MTTHVFIVSEETFPSHLRYQFAGTGAKDYDEWPKLLTDIKRVRAGDPVIFYIEATTKRSGGFYGVFQIAEQEPLTFEVNGDQAREPGLGEKKLIYRTLIKPLEVYSEGVPEWEALDKLPTYARDVQWSLIYRKLKAKRGCTPILPWESENLINLIRDKNGGKLIADDRYTGGLGWDSADNRIIVSPAAEEYPFSRARIFNTLNRICAAKERRHAYEDLIQMYLIENAGSVGVSSILGRSIAWIGNEVVCSVGKRQIDILTIQDLESGPEYRIVELKDEPVEPLIANQLEYYVKWSSQDHGKHLINAHNWNIQPVIVAPKHREKNWTHVKRALNGLNNKDLCKPTLYFEFDVQCGNNPSLIFNQVNY